MKRKGLGVWVFGKGRTEMKAKLLSKRDRFSQLLGHASCTCDKNFIWQIFTPKMKELAPSYTLLRSCFRVLLNSLQKPLNPTIWPEANIDICLFIISGELDIPQKHFHPPPNTTRLDFLPRLKDARFHLLNHCLPHRLEFGCWHEAGVSGQQLSWIHHWTLRLLQREEGLHAIRTKEVQHHSFCSSAAPEMQAAGGSSCQRPDAAVTWRLPLGLSHGNGKGCSWHSAGAGGFSTFLGCWKASLDV